MRPLILTEPPPFPLWLSPSHPNAHNNNYSNNKSRQSKPKYINISHFVKYNGIFPENIIVQNPQRN